MAEVSRMPNPLDLTPRPALPRLVKAHHRRGSLGNDPLVVFVIRKSLGPPPARAPPPALSSRIQTPPPPLMQGPGPPRHPGQGDEEEETEARGDAETETRGHRARHGAETRGDAGRPPGPRFCPRGDRGHARRREPASSILASILASIFSCCFVVSPPIALVVFAFSGRGGEDEVEEVALLCVTTAPHRAAPESVNRCGWWQQPSVHSLTVPRLVQLGDEQTVIKQRIAPASVAQSRVLNR
ncbi:unnamed protein product [Lampetra fluviatilis]